MHGNIGMLGKNRKGRKRKSTRREPNGRPQRVHVDYRAMVGQQPHRRDLPEAVRSSERAGSELGRLNLKHRISEHQYEAGQRYTVIVGAYRAMIGVPGHLVGSGRGYDCLGNCSPPDGISFPACLCLARKQRYDDAYCAIRTHAAHMAVNAVAIHDQPCAAGQLIHLRDGLTALARHFGLTNQRK